MKVLIVDDSTTSRFRLRQMVRKLGHEPVLARDGTKALEMARKERPDLILMDVIMPGMNGYEATRALARDAETRQIPVIFVTSCSEESDRAWGMRQGAADYVIKPVEFEQLQSAVNAAVNAAAKT